MRDIPFSEKMMRPIITIVGIPPDDDVDLPMVGLRVHAFEGMTCLTESDLDELIGKLARVRRFFDQFAPTKEDE